MKPLLFHRWQIYLIAIALFALKWSSDANAQSSETFSVLITQPAYGATVIGPNVELQAVTTDLPTDDVASVSFVAGPFGTNGPQPLFVIMLGSVSNGVPLNPPQPGSRLFTLVWTNGGSGMWSIRASAVTTNGASATSQPVTFAIAPKPSLSVDITSPANGSIFAAPTNIELVADVTVVRDSAAFVQFFDGAQLLGVVSNGLTIDPLGGVDPVGGRAYLFDWINQSLGSHSLTATVTDTNGSSFSSAPVTIWVGSNLPPTVRITSPADNTVFHAPVNVALLAYANDPGGYVSSVQFLVGSNSLGFGQPVRLPIAMPLTPVWPPILTPNNIFELIWSNAVAGSYAITALATAHNGISATSTPVNITIESVPPPPTNLPAIVDITATDPIAVEGTNCWPWLAGPLTWSNWVSPVAIFRWYTNCGPKDATFIVRRYCGESNKDLTVNYAIAGTASNGVDYVTLPGSVTIPAGQEAAMITVVPINENSSNLTSTVLLALEPDANSLPSYIVGSPRRAEALIIDRNGPWPTPPGIILPDRSFHLMATGPDGAWFHVDYSTNLFDWVTLCTNQVINGSIDFVDPDAALSPNRVYRTIPVANPSSE